MQKTTAVCSVPKSVTQGKVLRQIRSLTTQYSCAEYSTLIFNSSVSGGGNDQLESRIRALPVANRGGAADPRSPPHDCEPVRVNEPVDPLVNERMDEASD
jgi:hypothetical protein